MGFLSSLPIAVFIVNGELFFHLWLPTEDASLLYWLSIAGSIVMIIAMPLEPLWNIFTITNKVKKSSINLLEWSIAMFVCTIVCIQFTEDNIIRLFIIASVKSILASIRTLTFLPLYGAKCLKFPKYIFYKPIIHNLICLSIIIGCSIPFRFYFPTSWIGLIIGCIITSFIGLILNYFISLNKSDRNYIKSKIKGVI